MIIVLCALCSITACLALIAGFRSRKLLQTDFSSREAETGFDRSPQFYRPMDRLLSEADFQFVASCPGVSRQAVGKMRAERRRIFRLYLKSLAMEFALITADIREIMVLSQHSRSDLAATLASARLTFAVTMIAIEGRLLLHASGVHGVSISAARLTAGLAQMQQEFALLSPNPALLTS